MSHNSLAYLVVRRQDLLGQVCNLMMLRMHLMQQVELEVIEKWQTEWSALTREIDELALAAQEKGNEESITSSTTDDPADDSSRTI